MLFVSHRCLYVSIECVTDTVVVQHNSRVPKHNTRRAIIWTTVAVLLATYDHVVIIVRTILGARALRPGPS